MFHMRTTMGYHAGGGYFDYTDRLDCFRCKMTFHRATYQLCILLLSATRASKRAGIFHEVLLHVSIGFF